MKRPLFVMAGGFVLGEVLGLHITSAVLMCAAAAVAAALIWYVLKHGNRFLGGLFLVIVLLGSWRGNAERVVYARETSLCLDGVKESVSGRIESINEKQGRMELLIKPYGTDLRYLLIYADCQNAGRADEFSIGAEISATGRYSAFGHASDPGQFDYASYYRARKLTYRYFADEIKVTRQKRSLYDMFRERLRRFSIYLSHLTDAMADPGDAGILRSLILGDRSGLDAGVRDLYQKNGISHLLAISGLHLSIISAAVYGILRRKGLGYGRSALIGGSVLLSYCIMSGASPSSLRALIMLIMSYMAAFWGRSYDLLTALGLSAFWLFSDSPYQLTQSGPQLSFLAVLGIAALLALKHPDKGKKKGFRHSVYDILLSSTAVQLAAAPVILWNFFRFPLYGILINLFVLPLMGCVVASGAAGMLAGMINLSLGRFFMGAAHAILVWYDLLCRFFGSLPFSSLLLGRPSMAQICVYYGALAAVWLFLKERRSCDIFRMLPLLILLFPIPVLSCNVLFMDVGQGDGIVIRSPYGTVLVDGGSSSVPDLYSERLKPALESLAVSEIDCAIVSHAHADHTSGLYMLLDAESPVRIKSLVLPAAGRGDENYEKLAERAEDAGIKTFLMKTGDVIELGKMKLTCIYPDDSGGRPSDDANEHSLVIRLDYGGFSMLMGGDMTVNGENAIMADEEIARSLSDVQVLKVAHHGSSTSSSGPWLDVLSPRWAVVSYGEGNSYGHPANETMQALYERGIYVYETAKSGAISLFTDGKRIRWTEFRTRGRTLP